jgi:hypothetical protein
VLIVSHNRLRHFTVEAVSKFTNSLHVARLCFVHQRLGNLTQRLAILARRGNFHAQRVTE